MPSLNDAFPFPLVLTPFEHYLLADDCDDWPMTVSVRIAVTGSWKRSRLQRALTRSLVYHPLLRARIDGDIAGPTKCLRWIPHDVSPVVVWCDEKQAPQIDRRLDLQIESGLRIYAIERPANACLIVQWHHACCDGRGILNFVESLLLAYRDGDGTHESEMLRRNSDSEWWSNRMRNEFGFFQTLCQSPRHLSRIARFFINRTVPLALDDTPDKLGASCHNESEYCSYTLSQGETSSLLREAKRLHATMNDLLLARYYVTLMQWNARREDALHKQSIRLAIPISLRRGTSEQESAINLVSMVFFDRSSKDIQDDAELLKGLSREMQHVKKWKTGWALIYVLGAAGLMRGGMQRIVHAGGPTITSALSNLGIIFTGSPLIDGDGKLRADSVVVERVEPYAPVRPGVHVAVDVLTYAHRLTVTLNYDRAKFSVGSANRLLDLYIENLRSVVASARS